jgi:hypothetical protein
MKRFFCVLLSLLLTMVFAACAPDLKNSARDLYTFWREDSETDLNGDGFADFWGIYYEEPENDGRDSRRYRGLWLYTEVNGEFKSYPFSLWNVSEENVASLNFIHGDYDGDGWQELVLFSKTEIVAFTSIHNASYIRLLPNTASPESYSDIMCFTCRPYEVEIEGDMLFIRMDEERLDEALDSHISNTKWSAQYPLSIFDQPQPGDYSPGLEAHSLVAIDYMETIEFGEHNALLFRQPLGEWAYMWYACIWQRETYTSGPHTITNKRLKVVEEWIQPVGTERDTYRTFEP